MNPWSFWSSSNVAGAIVCPQAAIEANWPLIAAALDALGILDRPNALGVIGTIAIESASTFEPVREAFWNSEAWRREYLRYYPFYGRGFIQLTWEANYRAAGAALGVDLVGNPDLALDPDIGARILAWYWAAHGVRARDGSRWWSLPDLCRDGDWEWVRRVVQGGTDGLGRLLTIVTALDAIKEPPMPDTLRLRTTDAGVRLRAGPTTDSPILAAVPKGTAVEPLDERAWRRVRVWDREGWMAADYLEDAPADPAPPVGLQFNPDFVLRLQIQDFACSIRTTQMLLESIGIDVNIGVLQDQMVPRYVTRELGLLDGTGAGIVRLLQESYGVEAHTLSPAEFAPLSHLAGQCPIALGGHNWGGVGHWVAVRRFDGDALVLGNPAGDRSPNFGQQRIDRTGWQTIASAWSAVVITGRTA